MMDDNLTQVLVLINARPESFTSVEIVDANFPADILEHTSMPVAEIINYLLQNNDVWDYTNFVVVGPEVFIKPLTDKITTYFPDAKLTK